MLVLALSCSNTKEAAFSLLSHLVNSGALLILLFYRDLFSEAAKMCSDKDTMNILGIWA